MIDRKGTEAAERNADFRMNELIRSARKEGRAAHALRQATSAGETRAGLPEYVPHAPLASKRTDIEPRGPVSRAERVRADIGLGSRSSMDAPSGASNTGEPQVMTDAVRTALIELKRDRDEVGLAQRLWGKSERPTRA